MAAGAIAGESVCLPQPRVRSLTSMPATAGSAIWKSMSIIIPATSTSTVWPSRIFKVSGMVTGEMTVEISSVARPWATSPPNMEIHMADTTATGTEYSSTMPQTRSGSPPKNSVPRR